MKQKTIVQQIKRMDPSFLVWAYRKMKEKGFSPSDSILCLMMETKIYSQGIIISKWGRSLTHARKRKGTHQSSL